MNSIRTLLLAILLVLPMFLIMTPTAQAASTDQVHDKVKFRRASQFIAALGDPAATQGSGAQAWGLWTVDPGPRGVRLRHHAQLVAQNGRAPAGWSFNAENWWLEENGLIMEAPTFPLPPGQYLVTGFRETTSVLTVHPADAQGDRRWALADKATLYDVTHLGCRSAVYTPAAGTGSCSPASVNREDFPIDAGWEMPAVSGCSKQDYSVLIVVGVADRPS